MNGSCLACQRVRRSAKTVAEADRTRAAPERSVQWKPRPRAPSSGPRQLARVYLHAWLLTSEQSQAVTGNQFFRTITEEILDYVAREMLGESGAFCSTQDADSECESAYDRRCAQPEGKYSLVGRKRRLVGTLLI